MYSYWDTFKKHGLMLTLTMFLGNLTVSAVSFLVFFILFFVGAIIAVAGIAGVASQFGSLENPPSPEVFMEILSSPGLIIFALLFILFIIAFSLVIGGFQTAGSVAITIEAVAENRSNIGTFFIRGFKFIWKMIGLLFLCGLLWLIPVILYILSFFLFVIGNAGTTIIGILLILTGIILGIVIGLAVMHAPFILLAENTRVTQAISLSFYLFRKAFGRVFGSAFYAFLIYLVYYAIYLMSTDTLSDILRAFQMWQSIANGSPDSTMPMASSPFSSLISLFFSFVVAPIFATLATLLITHRYYKYLRIYINPNGTGGPTAHTGDSDSHTEPSFAIKTPSSSQTTHKPDHDNSFTWDEVVTPTTDGSKNEDDEKNSSSSNDDHSSTHN